MSVLSYKYKLFLQGHEIPFSSVEIHYSSQSSFSVEIPPVSEVNDIQVGTYGLIAYKKRGGDSKWHLLCEGVYTGPYYMKQGSSRSLRLRFRDLQWLPESTVVYSYLEMKNPPAMSAYIRTFVGDIRRDTPLNVDSDMQLTETAINFSTRFGFLDALSESKDSPGASPLGKIARAIFAQLENGNEFASEHSIGLKMNADRLLPIENKKMATIYGMDVVRQSFESTFAQITSSTNLMDLLLMLLQVIFYDIMPIPGLVKDEGSSLRSYVVKPDFRLVSPPACNVIFPDETVSFGFEVDYAMRPTRLMCGATQFNNEMRLFFAPPELKESITSGDYDNLLTNEEKIRGVLPDRVDIPFASKVAISSAGETTSEQDLYTAAFVNYTFYERSYRSVPMSVTTSFRPDILPGFPVLVLDKIMPMVGYCVNVSHTIDIGSGTAYTSMTLSHVRPTNVKMPILSGWYDEEKFHPDNIGEQVFRGLGTHNFWHFLEDGTSPEVETTEEGVKLVDYQPAVDALLDEYTAALQGELGRWKESWSRALPLFFDENNPGENDILNALNLTWDMDSELLRTQDGPSPLNVNIMVDGQSVNEIRARPVRRLKETLTRTKGLWTRHIIN